MTVQNGKDLLLRLDIDGQGSFTTVAGMRSRQLALNAETVDITDADSQERWRELLSGAGRRRASVSGSGIFKDDPSDAVVRESFFAGIHRRWQVIIPDFGTLEGPFEISALEYGGEHDREVTFSMSLESAGPVSFVPA